MTTDTTLHHDVRKLLTAIDVLLTQGTAAVHDPVQDMLNDLTAIRHDLGQCAQAMQTAAAMMRKASDLKGM